MKKTFILLVAAVGVLAFGNCQPQPSPSPDPGPRPGPAATVVNMIPAVLSGETFQDSEPFLAVNAANSNQMVGSAFTLNPAGPASATAPIYFSLDGGNTWALNNTVPSQAITGDISPAFAADLYTGILRRPGSLLLNALRTAQFDMPVLMMAQNARTQVDQPFLIAGSVGGNDHIYVGNNDFNVLNGRTATVDVSFDGGANYVPRRIESRNTSGQDGPSIRPALADDGTVYAAYFGWRTRVGNVSTADVVVVRDDNRAQGANAFQDLVGSDGQPGVRVVQGVQIPFINAPTLGQERIGSTLSLAVQPNDSSRVYVAWADRVGNGDIYTVHLRASQDGGQTWSQQDLRTAVDATCVSLAVAQNGTVGFLYQQVVNNRWRTHLEQSADQFATIVDTLLADTSATQPAVTFLPYIGDYNYLLAVGNEFRGVFSASNLPDNNNFPQGVTYQRAADFQSRTLQDGMGGNVPVSIDPFYFQVPVLN